MACFLIASNRDLRSLVAPCCDLFLFCPLVVDIVLHGPNLVYAEKQFRSLAMQLGRYSSQRPKTGMQCYLGMLRHTMQCTVNVE